MFCFAQLTRKILFNNQIPHKYGENLPTWFNSVHCTECLTKRNIEVERGTNALKECSSVTQYNINKNAWLSIEALLYWQDKSLCICKDFEGISWLTKTLQDSIKQYKTIISEYKELYSISLNYAEI